MSDANRANKEGRTILASRPRITPYCPAPRSDVMMMEPSKTRIAERRLDE
jgi:hypothetical protein